MEETMTNEREREQKYPEITLKQRLRHEMHIVYAIFYQQCNESSINESMESFKWKREAEKEIEIEC